MAAGLRVAREHYRIADVSRDEVLRYLGYGGQELTSELEQRMDDLVRRCLNLARPRGSLASFLVRGSHVREALPCDPSLNSDSLARPIELEGCALRLSGHSIAEHLEGAREVILLAVTLGADVDRELRRLSLIDPLGQVVFDATATALVERAADAAEAHARAYAAERGGYPSWRYSPGYGDLPLACQADLLSALDAGRQLGITLTSSSLMVPTKSVTAIVGVHPTPQPGLEDACATCNLREFCTIRSSGRTCRG